ncbi:hypothetical protein RRG08_033216 [Elysia crispata]|uniref:Uncharacterized protein n=1 Tax=Elysia crispata TaxID=231223 RepID=A0AAE1BC60_9GAST|nr:hypothetical protein RRG08_033216 [Elysia crispata]
MRALTPASSQRRHGRRKTVQALDKPRPAELRLQAGNAQLVGPQDLFSQRVSGAEFRPGLAGNWWTEENRIQERDNNREDIEDGATIHLVEQE